MIEKGYGVVGALVSNQPLDTNGIEFAEANPNIRVYDRPRICSEVIDIDTEGGIRGQFVFDASYVAPMEIQVSEKTRAYVLPVLASELVKMEGIDDGSLFSQNVRLSLGNTKVNKALRESVAERTEHKNFPLYHNGINILCAKATYSDGKLSVQDYVVVNGAQSITTFKRASQLLSSDLRVIAKVIELDDTSLARKITVNSNNQNAIKPRDLKSTNDIQLRLREEFKLVANGAFDFEIKRGQDIAAGKTIISNEEAGRLLLAFDLSEPESCHQVYKLFDEKYSDIFARPEVNAWRIVVLSSIMIKIMEAMEAITYKPLAKYGLTRFFMLSVIGVLIKRDTLSDNYLRNPKSLFEEGRLEDFCAAVGNVLASIIVDLNYEVGELGDTFDYKGDLKSPSKIRELRTKLLRSFEKDVARGKAEPLSALLAKS